MQTSTLRSPGSVAAGRQVTLLPPAWLAGVIHGVGGLRLLIVCVRRAPNNRGDKMFHMQDIAIIREIGRSERIRTSDPLLPKQVRYQTALRSDRGGGLARNGVVCKGAWSIQRS